MNAAVLVLAVLALTMGVARSQDRLGEPQPLACVPPRRARELLFEKKLVAPMRAMRNAAVAAPAEPIDIQLCWFGPVLVYDVTLLSRDGRVMHRLIQAVSGDALGGPEKRQ